MRNRALVFAVALALVVALVPGPAAGAAAKPKIAKEKQAVLDWLGQAETVEKFGKISDEIWKYAELGLQEFNSSKLLADTLEAAGFTVERGLAGMPTCFVATYGSGKPVIGLLGEFDALPMISQKGRVPKKDPVVEGAPGHGCGHNAMCVAAAAAAIAVKEAMDAHGIKGTIKVFGSPAEEIVASRPYMIRAGLFEGVDAVIDNHSSSGFGTGYGVGGNALFSTIFTFKGKTAHCGRRALGRPERPRRRRDHERGHELPPRAPAPLPAPALRDPRGRRGPQRRPGQGQRLVLRPQHRRAARGHVPSGSSTAPRPGPWPRAPSSCRCGSSPPSTSSTPTRPRPSSSRRTSSSSACPPGARRSRPSPRPCRRSWGPRRPGCPTRSTTLEAPGGVEFGGGSSDVGDVTLIAPTATIGFPGAVPGAIGHHWSNVACWYGSTAWKGLNAGAKAIAASAVDLLTKPEELAKLRKEFEEYSKTHPYKPFLPADATPPNDLNKELMDKYRGLLEKALAEK